MTDVVKPLGNSQVLTSNNAFLNARLVRVTNLGTTVALVTVADPIANSQIGNYYLVGGSSVSLQKAPREVLSSNSAASVVGVACSYTN